jgi:hypothetical protein
VQWLMEAILSHLLEEVSESNLRTSPIYIHCYTVLVDSLVRCCIWRTSGICHQYCGTAAIFFGIYILFSIVGHHWTLSHYHMAANHWPTSPHLTITLPCHLPATSAYHVSYGFHVSLPCSVRMPRGNF